MIYFPIYVITTANIATSLDRTGTRGVMITVGIYLSGCGEGEEAKAATRREEYPERREERKETYGEEIFVSRSESPLARVSRPFISSVLALCPPSRLLRASRRIYEERTRDAKCPFSFEIHLRAFRSIPARR